MDQPRMTAPNTDGTALAALPCPMHYAASCPPWCSDGAGHPFDTTDASGRSFARVHHSQTWTTAASRAVGGVLRHCGLDVVVEAVESTASEHGPCVTGPARIHLTDDAAGLELHANALTAAQARRLGVALIRAAQLVEEDEL